MAETGETMHDKYFKLLGNNFVAFAVLKWSNNDGAGRCGQQARGE